MNEPVRKAGVIGWPIGHSRSPLIHGHWLRRYGLSGSYDALAIAPDGLGDFADRLRQGEYVGCNVTVPHKTAILEWVDETDAAVRAIGAGNTLVVRDGRIHASNTDAFGFTASLEAQAPRWRERQGAAVVLGAGGAARAILWGLLDAGVRSIRLVNRTRARADTLAGEFGDRVSIVEWAQRDLALDGASLLVNTTVLGMAGGPALDLALDHLPSTATVCDIVYVPLETPLLASARAKGCSCVDGLGMLLHQAVPGFAAWFGVTPEVTPELRTMVVADLEREA